MNSLWLALINNNNNHLLRCLCRPGTTTVPQTEYILGTSNVSWRIVFAWQFRTGFSFPSMLNFSSQPKCVNNEGEKRLSFIGCSPQNYKRVIAKYNSIHQPTRIFSFHPNVKPRCILALSVCSDHPDMVRIFCRLGVDKIWWVQLFGGSFWNEMHAEIEKSSSQLHLGERSRLASDLDALPCGLLNQKIYKNLLG